MPRRHTNADQYQQQHAATQALFQQLRFEWWSTRPKNPTTAGERR